MDPPGGRAAQGACGAASAWPAHVRPALNTGLHHRQALQTCRLPRTLKPAQAGVLDVDAPSREMYTPLMLAAMAGHTYTVELLLRHGAQLGRRSRRGATAIVFAAQSPGNLDALRMLLQHPSCTPQLVRQLGYRQRSALVQSVLSHGSPAVVRWGGHPGACGLRVCRGAAAFEAAALDAGKDSTHGACVSLHASSASRLTVRCLAPAVRCRCVRCWARAPTPQRRAPPWGLSRCCTPAPTLPGGCCAWAQGGQRFGVSATGWQEASHRLA